MRREKHPPAALPRRRDILAGLALGASLGPAFAASPPGENIRAAAIPARLTPEAARESTLFRLLRDGAPSPPMGWPDPPVLRFRPGAEARIGLANGLDRPLSLGLRGLRRAVAGEATGALPPGGRGEMRFPASQGGSFLLEPAPPAPMREAVARGLHGLVIVEEDNPPEVDSDLALLVGDWRLTAEGELAGEFGEPRDAARLGRLGNRLVINGYAAPLAITARPGARLRLRLANVATARTIPLHAQNLLARLIAIDSTPCAPFDPLERMVTLAPGNRCEMIVDLPREGASEARIEARFANPAPLLTVRIEGEPLPMRGPVPALPDPGLPAAIRLQNAARADLAITGGWPREADPEAEATRRLFPDPARIFALNGGALGDRAGEPPGRPLIRVKKGREIVLAIANRTAWPQVIGVAGHAFRLLHPLDDGWEPYFLDCVYIRPGQTHRIAFIADLAGHHAIRSTIADHAEAGVATHFQVTE